MCTIDPLQDEDTSGNGPRRIHGFLFWYLEKLSERFRIAPELVSSEETCLTSIVHPVSEFRFY